MLCFSVNRNNFDSSLDGNPVAAAATAILCRLIILPMTPPLEFDAAIEAHLGAITILRFEVEPVTYFPVAGHEQVELVIQHAAEVQLGLPAAQAAQHVAIVLQPGLLSEALQRRVLGRGDAFGGVYEAQEQRPGGRFLDGDGEAHRRRLAARLRQEFDAALRRTYGLTYGELEAAGQLVLRYAEDCNGSVGDVAGVCNETRNVFGLMPHPEHAVDPLTGSTDGLRVFDRLAQVKA